jgi:hypothetical protein
MNQPSGGRTMNKKHGPIHVNIVEVALGDALEWSIQRWVAWSGREVRVSEAPWLEGPVGDDYIGAEFYAGYAGEAGLEAVANEDAGLLPDFGALAGDGFDPDRVNPTIRDFYKRTARYDLLVRIGWSGPFRHPPRTLIYLVGRNVGQFDLPLSSSTVEMENELIGMEDPPTGVVPYVGWLRRSSATGRTMLSGLYTTCGLPLERGRFFKGVYPLPGGSATTSFGEAGYYRIHRTGGALRVKQVPLREILHVSPGPDGTLLAQHEFAFCGARFLTLHYEISCRD